MDEKTKKLIEQLREFAGATTEYADALESGDVERLQKALGRFILATVVLNSL